MSIALHIFSIPMFEKSNPELYPLWPKLSIVIPACNEARTITKAVTSILRQDYPPLEIIIVNDRSTDQTGQIIDEYAAKDPRFKIIHIKELPPQWLGKTYALHRGTQEATGQWILYTDADVHLTPGILTKAVALAMRKDIDHLTLLARPIVSSFWLEVATRTFGMALLYMTGAGKVNRLVTKAYMGIGSFNLVRKRALDKTPGFSWLRMEVGDDLGLGLMLHHAGARTFFMMAFQDIAVSWHSSIGEMATGFEKYGAFYPPLKVFFLCIIAVLMFAAPFVSFLYITIPNLWAAGAAALGSVLFFSYIGTKHFKNTLLPSVFTPIGVLINAVILLRASLLCGIRNGIIWRGKFYKKKELRSFKRLPL